PLPWALLELERWLEDNPEHNEQLTEREFLTGVVAETLRLHPSSPYLFRVAREDIKLRSGVAIPKGRVACCMVYDANRDTATFGDNAATFDPYRPQSGTMHPYGLAFGMGRHLCIGFPVVVGSRGVDGVEVEVLHALLAAGVRTDPNAGAALVDHPYRESFESYPVQFVRDARTRQPRRPSTRCVPAAAGSWTSTRDLGASTVYRRRECQSVGCGGDPAADPIRVPSGLLGGTSMRLRHWTTMPAMRAASSGLAFDESCASRWT